MSPEREEQLCSKYPLIFNSGESSQSSGYRWWGFECGDGWFNIIDTLCGCIQNHINRHTKDLSFEEKEEFQVRAMQVKEKFGGLRFYCTGGDDNIHAMISVAESMSYKTCEACGSPGKPMNDGWIRTMCSMCWDEFKKNNIEYT